MPRARPSLPMIDDPETGERPRSIRRPRSNVAPALTSFVGRREILGELLGEGGGRLVTLFGPAGSGKTRVAEEALRLGGDAWLERWAGGAWICDLTEARTVDGICAVVAETLGLPLTQGKSPEDNAQRVGAALAARGPTLIVLDNFEGVRAHSAATLERWLRAAPEARFWITSRERVGLRGEQVLAVPPLELGGATCEAVRLFVERARAVRNAYTPEGDELAAVEAIVRQLDGLPLAIELAASRMHVLSARQLQTHLGRRFELLVDRGRQGHSRHSTLRAALDGSWALLQPWEKRALAQCAVFRGGFSLDAAYAVIDLDDPQAPWALDLIQALCDRSLIQTYESPSARGEVRYRLYENVREYAALQLVESGEVQAATDRHAAYYLSLVEKAVDAPAERARTSIAPEVENLLALSRRALAGKVARGKAEIALRVAAGLAPLLRARGPLGVAKSVLDAALEAARLVPAADALRAACLLERGEVHEELGDQRRSAADRDAALVLADQLGEPRLRGRALASVARLAWHEGRLDDARNGFEEALALHRHVDDRVMEGRTESDFARALYLQGDVDGARAHYAAAFDRLQESGDRQAEALARANLASLEHDLGRPEQARHGYAEALELARELEDRRVEARIVMRLGHLAVERRELDRADQSYREALAIERELGHRRGEGEVLAYLAQCDALRGRTDAARTGMLDALARLRHAGHPVMEALVTSWLGRLEADADRIAAALRHLDAADAIIADHGRTIVAEVPRICRGHVELARARAAEGRGQRGEGARHRELALRIAERSARASAVGLPSTSSDIRLALITLRRGMKEGTSIVVSAAPVVKASPDGLIIAPDGRSFQVPGKPPVDLSTRRAPRLILAALAKHREVAPNTALSVDDLLAAGWPGERVLPEAGASRVYTAIATLRRKGLKPYLVRRDDGYLLR